MNTKKTIIVYSIIPEQTFQYNKNKEIIFKNDNLIGKDKSNIKYDKISLDVDSNNRTFKRFPMDDIVSILDRKIWIEADDLQGLLVVSKYKFPYSEFSKQEQNYFLTLFANYVIKKD